MATPTRRAVTRQSTPDKPAPFVQSNSLDSAHTEPGFAAKQKSEMQQERPKEKLGKPQEKPLGSNRNRPSKPTPQRPTKSKPEPEYGKGKKPKPFTYAKRSPQAKGRY
ncbi:MAG: hypothetical protein KGI03_00915 [Patescibacteria group bacterium]|nr:hypothetical protein [Patescibacteria group bacterium]